MKPFKINDILYTKDGRKSGNITIVDIDDNYIITTENDVKVGPLTKVTGISDYGNLVYIYPEHEPQVLKIKKRYYSTRGRATIGHKYHNYYENHPELLL